MHSAERSRLLHSIQQNEAEARIAEQSFQRNSFYVSAQTIGQVVIDPF